MVIVLFARTSQFRIIYYQELGFFNKLKKIVAQVFRFIIIVA